MNELPRDHWIPRGRYCQPKDGEDCVFFDGYDWLSGLYLYCHRYNQALRVDYGQCSAIRVAECHAENPDSKPDVACPCHKSKEMV